MSYSPKVAKLLVEKYGWSTQPDGAVVSPGGYTRNEAGKTVKYTAPAADPVASAAPVVAADPVTANLDPVTAAPASMADVKQNSLDQLMALANQTAASNQQLSNQLGFGPGPLPDPTPDPEPEGTGVMYRGEELSQDQVDTITKRFKPKAIEKYGLEYLIDKNASRFQGTLNPEAVAARKKEKRKEKREKKRDDAREAMARSAAADRGQSYEDYMGFDKSTSERLGMAKDDLVTRGGQLGGDLKDLASSVGGGITNLVDKGKQFFGGTAPGAITSDDGSNVGLRPAGLDNFGYDEDGEVFDSATYSTTPNIFGEVGRGSGYNIPTSVGGGSSSDDVYQDAILRGGTGASGPAQGTDDSGFTSGVLPSSMLGQMVGDNDFNRFQKLRPYGPDDNPQIAFLRENDPEWFEDWEDRFFNFGITGQDRQDAFPTFLDEIQDRYNSFVTGERGDRGPTVTVDGYQGSAYDELGPSPGDLAAIGGDVVTYGDGMGEGQDQIYIGVDGTYNPIGGEDDTSLNEGQGDIFTNVDPVTFDPVVPGGGGGQGGGGEEVVVVPGGGPGGEEVVVVPGGGPGPDSDPDPSGDDFPDIPDGVVIPDPVDPDPDPDDPFVYDPIRPFVPSNIQVPSFLQPSLVPYSGNAYAAPSMDFIRANQVNPFADPYANVFVARNGGIVSLR